LPGACLVTLVQFDDKYEVHYTAKPVAEVEPLVLVPRGNTAMLDAIGRALTETGERLAALSETQRPRNVHVLIISDGQENASREYVKSRGGQARIAEMIRVQRELYSWEFTYLGANQNAIEVAAAINIPEQSSVTFETSNRGTVAMSATIGSRVAATRAGASAPDATRVYARAYAGEEPPFPAKKPS
jgi:hypothetical protein